MQATDFIYDGVWLSDLGFMICTFDSGGVETATAGSTITFNTIKQHKGMKFVQTSSEYDEGFSTTFEICKISEDSLGKDITINEYRMLMRWLNRPNYHLFSLVDRHEDEWSEVYYEGSFNIERINFSGRLIGLALTFYSNRPFGIGKVVEKKLTFTNSGDTDVIRNYSDEIGKLYPEQVTITCRDSGTLSITNNLDNSIVTILNCTSGEVITMDCVNQIITSSVSSHAIYNDFNYVFFRLYNDIKQRTNIYTVSIPCEITVVYRPVIKVVF